MPSATMILPTAAVTSSGASYPGAGDDKRKYVTAGDYGERHPERNYPFRKNSILIPAISITS